MAEDSVPMGGEGDLFDRWLAHREGDDPSGGQLRASTVPPKWAPQVVRPRADPEPPPDVLAEVPVAPDPVAPDPVAPEPVVEAVAVEPDVVEADVVEPDLAEAEVAEPDLADDVAEPNPVVTDISEPDA